MREFEGNKDGLELDLEASNSLLRDLEKNTPDEIRRQRRYFRAEVKATVTLQSGNASQFLDGRVRGVTGDISEGGLSGLFPLPIGVGDIYRLTFDRDKLDLPMLFSRCIRCRYVRENAYEAGFSFFAPIEMPASLMHGAQ